MSRHTTFTLPLGGENISLPLKYDTALRFTSLDGSIPLDNVAWTSILGPNHMNPSNAPVKKLIGDFQARVLFNHAYYLHWTLDSDYTHFVAAGMRDWHTKHLNDLAAVKTRPLTGLGDYAWAPDENSIQVQPSLRRPQS